MGARARRPGGHAMRVMIATPTTKGAAELELAHAVPSSLYGPYHAYIPRGGGGGGGGKVGGGEEEGGGGEMGRGGIKDQGRHIKLRKFNVEV